MPHPKRIANGEYLVPHLKRVGIAQHNGGQLVQPDLENRKVAVGVGANDLRACVAAVIEHHFDFVGALDHMVVGENVAAGADDDTAAQATLRFIALVAVEELEPRVIGIGVLVRELAGVDAHHGAGRLFGRHAQAPRWWLLYRVGRCLQHCHAAAGPGRNPAQPLRLERGHHKQCRQQHGDGLGKNQPKSFHSVRL